MKSSIIKIIAALSFVSVFAGCVVPPSYKTASGRPDIEIATKNMGRLKSEIITKMLDHGASLVRDTDYMLEFSLPLTGGEQFSTAMSIGNASSHNWKSVSYTFAPTQNGIRIIGSCSVVAELPGGRVNRQSLDQNGVVFDSFQRNLIGLKKVIEEEEAKASAQ